MDSKLNAITKILILEHNHNDVELIKHELKAGGIDCTTQIVQNECDYLKAINNNSPDIILSDYSLPSFDGSTAFKIRQELVPDTPFIFVSGSIGEENSIEFIKKGVTDYVLKENLRPLNTKINRALKEARERREYKEAAEEIKASEMLYHSLFDNMQEGFAYCKMIYEKGVAVDFRYLDVNAAFKKLTGLTEVVGEKVSKVIPGIRKDNPGLFETYDRVAITGKPERFEVRVEALDMWLDISVYSTEMGYFTTVFDVITGKKMAEEKLANSEKHFRVLIEKSADMITLSSRDGKVLYSSPAVTKVLGYTTEEFSQKYPEDIIHPDDLNSYLSYRNNILTVAGEYFFFQQRRRHKNGSWIWCEGTVTNMLQEPSINALVSNFRDISEKKTAELEQEFSKNNLKALINNTHDLMWSVDREFNLITANKPFDEMSAAMFGKIIAPGTSVLSVAFTLEMQEHFKQLYRRAFAGESFTMTDHFDIPVETWAEISYYPIRKGDEIIGTACHSRDITASKLAERSLFESEASLKKSKQHLQTILDQSMDIISTVNDKGEFVTMSAACKKLWGYEVEELVGKPFIDFVYEEDVPKTNQIAIDIANGEQISNFENRYKCKNGKLTPVIWSARWDIESNLMYAVARDGTEKSRAEEKIRESEAQLNQAQAIAHLGSGKLDFSTNILTLTEEGRRIFELPQGENQLSYEAWSSLVHPQDLPEVLRILEKAVAKLTKVTYDFRLQLKNGTIKHVHSESKFELGANGAPIGMYGIFQDISERKVAEKKVEELHETIKAAFHQQTSILNALPSSIALLDAKGVILAVNEAWVKFAEDNNLKSDNHCVGDNYLKVSAKATGKDQQYGVKMVEGIKYVLEGGENRFEMEYPCHSPTEKRWFNVQVRSLSEAENSGVVVMHINVTAQKLAHDAIININEALEQRVMLRTTELTEANKSLEAFSYSVSHDLRSPVRSVMGFAKLIRKDHGGDLSEKATELFGYIEESGKRMNAIINDLLSFAKWGKEKLQLTEVDMTALFNHVWKNTLLEFPNNAVLEMQRLPKVQADKAMIRQVVVNFVSNAVKYSSKKEKPVVKVGFEETTNEIIFHVSDNGAGFDMVNYDRLFGAFQRLHGVTDFEGTGIGLALIKTIIEKHKGRVWAEGKVDEGATFYFSLPK